MNFPYTSDAYFTYAYFTEVPEVDPQQVVGNSGLLTPPPSPSLPFAPFHYHYWQNGEEADKSLRDNLGSLTLNPGVVDDRPLSSTSPVSVPFSFNSSMSVEESESYIIPSTSMTMTTSERRQAALEARREERKLKGTGPRRRRSLPTEPMPSTSSETSGYLQRSISAPYRTRPRSYRVSPYLRDHDAINNSNNNNSFDQVDAIPECPPSPLMQIAGLYPI